jgi:hypothetical protein
LLWRSTRLPAAEQRILRDEVLVARAGAREPSHERQIEEDTDRLLKERLAKNPITRADLPEVRKQILEQVKAEYQLVPPGYVREWKIDLSAAKAARRDQPLYLRIKFNAADRSSSGTFAGLWQIGAARPDQPPMGLPPMSLAPDTFHEFPIPNLTDDKGVLTVAFLNPNQTALLFPLDDGFEVLYRESGFALNYARGLGIIFCWMALLAALGLAAASFLSFPVAAFLSLGVLTLVLSSGTMANAVSQGTLMGSNSETGQVGSSILDGVMIPAFRALLNIINLAKDFSPIEALSTGRSITWAQLGLAFVQIVVVLGGILGLGGIFIFSRRELATAQGNQ